MDRIRVVGVSGSGKTTTAAAIAARLGVPHLELDSVHWLPGWVERDADDMRRIVDEFARSEPRWVIDGNYRSRLGHGLASLVDTYVWLDLPRWRVMVAIVARTVRRSVTAEELWGTGNRERASSLFKRDPLENIAMWAWTQHGAKRAEYEADSRSHEHRWVRLGSRRQVRRFLREL